MIKSNFSIQVHNRRRSGTGTHWDFRVYDPTTKKVLSWAIPKQKMPTMGERLFAAWVDDKHPISHMSYEGRRQNGDTVKLYDVGKINIHKLSEDRMIFDLHGKHITGNFIMINKKIQFIDDHAHIYPTVIAIK